MTEQATAAAAPRRDPMRPLRYLYRAPLLLLLAVIAFPLALFVFSPLARGMTVKGERLAHWMQRWWSGRLVRCFGFRIHRVGQPLPGAVMFVANHVSWLDIELMHSQRVMAFVAKEEISRWPLVGWLATRAGTIYHRRGSTHSLGAVQEQMCRSSAQRHGGRHFSGRRHRPGRSRAHVSCAHFPGGGRNECAGAAGRSLLRTWQHHGSERAVRAEENFLSNFLRLLGGPSMDATVYFLEPVPLSEEGRRHTAEAARQRIAAALQLVAE